MHTSGTTLWSGEGAQETGVWECTPGPSRWSLADNEFVHILSGRMTVTPDGGEPAEIGPGDTAVFPRGWAGTWQIHETIRKLYEFNFRSADFGTLPLGVRAEPSGSLKIGISHART